MTRGVRRRAIEDLCVSPAALIETAELVAAGSTIGEAIESTWMADVARAKGKARRCA